MTETLSDLEKQVDAAYKKSWSDAMAEAGVSNGWDLPRDTRYKLAENGRKEWEAFYARTTSEKLAESRAQTVAQRKATYESTFGVSDLAPPKKGAAQSPSEPTSPPPSVNAAPEPTDADTGSQAGAAATVVERRPSPTPSPSRRPSPTPEPMDFGSADDVNRAVKSLFGTSMEDV